MSNVKDYNIISDNVYRIDEKDDEYDPSIKEEGIIETGGNEYKILKTEDNLSNGMQAMAVAPVKDGTDDVADTSEVVIAYAGTNELDFADLNTDLQTVCLGNKEYL